MSNEKISSPIKQLNVSPDIRAILKRMQERPQGLNLQSLREHPQKELRKKKKKRAAQGTLRKLLSNDSHLRQDIITILEAGGSFGDVDKILKKTKEKITKKTLVSFTYRLRQKQGIAIENDSTSKIALINWLREQDS